MTKPVTETLAAASCILVDWGSSRFRAFLVDRDGAVLARTENDKGVLFCDNDDYAVVLANSCLDWHQSQQHLGNTQSPLPIIMGGMIGSRNGWYETAYVPCPVGIDDLTQQLVKLDAGSSFSSNPHYNSLVNDSPVYIVPGIRGKSLAGFDDVMRGEELQIFGALQLSNSRNALVCLPGTHSKWARVRDGKIVDFSTFMTGETYNLIATKSSISTLLGDTCNNANNNADNNTQNKTENETENETENKNKSSADHASFAKGVTESKIAGGMLHHLFSIRSRSLTASLACENASAYLSGLLIGHEINEVIAGPGTDVTEDVIVVGNSQLTERYRQALDLNQRNTKAVDAEAAFIQGAMPLHRSLAPRGP